MLQVALTGFCRCQNGKRENLMLDASEYNNPKVKCLSCRSTYSPVGAK